MSTRSSTFRRQLVLLSAAVTTVAVVLLTLLVQLVLARTSTHSVDQVLEDRATSVVAAIRTTSVGDQIVVPPSDLGAGVAVYDASGALVAGSAPTSLAEVYADLSTSSAPTVTPEIQDTNRVRAQPFTISSGAAGVVVVAERLRPYESAERYALAVSLVTGLLAVLASAALAAWVSRRALRPVLEMATTAGEWSEHDLGRRFDLGGPDNEITALGGTLDGLLDKVSVAIRSEQRLTAELAHELRTPLTAIQGTADLMALRPDLDPQVRDDVAEMQTAARRMAETITTLLELARSTSSLAAATVADLPAALGVVTRQHPSVVVDLAGTQRLRVAMPEGLVVRAVTPVVENAVRMATHVTISASRTRPGYVGIVVVDDGPGVAPDDRERIFEAGRSIGVHAGSGLGLPLARRIARSAGGDVRLEPSEAGSRFVIELPLT